MSIVQLCNNYISRIVAFVLTPILLPVAASVANWLQDVLGLDLDGADLTAFVVAVVVGAALTAFQWLRGRVRWEVALAELEHIKSLGNDALATGVLEGRKPADAPVVPPGLRP